MNRGSTKRMGVLKGACVCLILATAFAAGWNAGRERSFQQGFETGYDSASNHISTRIREGMTNLEPFYVSDIGFRFRPRGYTITGLTFIGDGEYYTNKPGDK